MKYICNICGEENEIESSDKLNREFTRTGCCNSSPRMRMIIHALSMEIFGKSMILRDFPQSKALGLGISDWEGYAHTLSKKFNYTNTYYHKEPRLDIADVPISQKGKYDFVLCSDVLEHVDPPVSRGFRGLYDLLRPGGVVIFSVPFMFECGYQEYYPNLYKYKIIDKDGQKILKNITKQGAEEEFSNLWFHGGEGAILALRLFTEEQLLKDLLMAGFEDVKTYRAYMKYGAYWPESYSQCMALRKSTVSDNNGYLIRARRRFFGSK